MALACIGVNHKSTPLGLRERLALGREAQRHLLRAQELRALARRARLDEFAILSTCNRTELYAASASSDEGAARLPAAPDELLAWLALVTGVPHPELRSHAYQYVELRALRHLCRVAAGLDSMVLGESEILGQVVTACETATREGVAGPLLEAAFRAAVRAGRRARTETGIGRLPASVSSEAVRLLLEIAGPLRQLAILIVGTGKMGRLTGEALRAAGAEHITIVSRTTEHAETLARGWGAGALAWHDLPAAIRSADAILCSTGAPHAVVTRELVERAIGGPAPGDPRRRVFVDIAVPRDVEPAVAELPGVELFDIDTLQHRLGGNLDVRQREVPAVEQIVDEEVERFARWLQGLAMRPVLLAVRARSEAIRQRELQRLFHRLGDVPPGLRAQLEAFSESLVNKLLHEPTRRLREASDPEHVRRYSAFTRELFGLDDSDRSVGGGAA